MAPQGGYMKTPLGGTDLNVEVIEANRLSTKHFSMWSAIQQTASIFANPFFCPEYTHAVAGVRSDVYVAIIRRGGEITGFFPFQRGRFAMGRPVGDWLSPLNGVIISDGLNLDAHELIRRCGLRGWDFDFLPASLSQFEPHHRSTDLFSYMDLSDGYDAYVAGRSHSGTRQITTIVALMRKFEREIGSLKFEFHTHDTRALDALLEWRFGKYGSSGAIDVRRNPWAWKLVQRLQMMHSANFAGALSVLSVNEEPIAAHMGIRSRTVLHYWLPAYNPKYARYSPGLMLLLRMAQQAPVLGLRSIDLGGGLFLYKQRLMSGQYPVAEGTVGLPGPVRTASRVRRRAYQWVRKSQLLSPPARLIARKIRQLRRAFKQG